MALTVVIAGEESAGARAVQDICAAGHRVPAVLTGANGAGQQSGPVARAASDAGLTVLAASAVKDPGFADRMLEWGVDLLVNVHSLHVIHDAVLEAPRIGSFNLHPGPLPRYAGLNALSWAIARGEREYGTTLHWMEPSIDTGAIAYQTLFEIVDGETALSLSLKCLHHGLPLVTRLLQDASVDAACIPATPQRTEDREYFRKRDVPHGMWVDWEGSAATIERLVRACMYDPYPSPWGKPRALFGDREMGIGQVSLTGEACGDPPGYVRAGEGGHVDVATGDEWIRIDKIILEGKIAVPAEHIETGALLITGRDEDTPEATESADGPRTPSQNPRDQVLEIFREKLHMAISEDQTDLVESGQLDSLSFVGLVFELEKVFGIEVDLAEVDFADFRSADAIAAFVEHRRSMT